MIFKLQKIKRITAIYFICLFFLYRFASLPDLFYMVATICYIVIPAYGALKIRSNFYLNAISSIKNKKAVVLTFNLSNNETNLLGLLDLLGELGIKAMFFVTGQIANKNPDWIKMIHQKGHEIGNHSYDLSKGFGFYETSKLMVNLEETEKLISKITGREIVYFRPPHGITNPFVRKATTILNYTVVGWNFILNQKKLNKHESNNGIAAKIRGGEIILIDLCTIDDIGSIKDFINKIQKRHFGFQILD